MKIMVVAAHPDDEILGCGGTIINHVRSHDEVVIVVISEGVTSRIYDPAVPRSLELRKCRGDLASRKKEFYQAARKMGVEKKNCHWLGLPDQRLDGMPLLDIIKPIERISRRLMPDIVYTHHWGDINLDHRICCEAVVTAFRPNRQNNKNTSVLCFEVPGNMDVLPPLAGNRFRPDINVDVSSSMKMKIAALQIYVSEKYQHPALLSVDGILKQAEKRARGRKYKYVEAFETAIRGIKR